MAGRSAISGVTFKTRFDGYRTNPEYPSDFHHAIVKEGFRKIAVYSKAGELSCTECPDECVHIRAVWDHLPTQPSKETMESLAEIAKNY